MEMRRPGDSMAWWDIWSLLWTFLCFMVIYELMLRKCLLMCWIKSWCWTCSLSELLYPLLTQQTDNLLFPSLYITSSFHDPVLDFLQTFFHFISSLCGLLSFNLILFLFIFLNLTSWSLVYLSSKRNFNSLFFSRILSSSFLYFLPPTLTRSVFPNIHFSRQWSSLPLVLYDEFLASSVFVNPTLAITGK